MEAKALIVEVDRLQRESNEIDAQLKARKAELAERMGDTNKLVYKGLVVTKKPNVRYTIDSDFLVNTVPEDVLVSFQELVFNKTKLERAVQTGVITAAVCDKALDKEDRGWVVSVQKVKRA